LLTINAGIGGTLPIGALQLGDVIKISSSGQEFPVGVVTVNSTSQFQCNTTNSAIITTTVNLHFDRERQGTGVTDYDITLPQGLYDLNLLNTAVATQLENEGASSTSEAIVSFNADNATQKVNIRLPFPSSSVDFTRAQTPRAILGFNSQMVGPEPSAPINVLAPNTAAFNQVNYLLLHTDLTNLGIRFNNQYSQVVSQILIDRPPGSQILFNPFNPARISVPELIGSTRTSIRVWLTDDQNRPVNTNGEEFSARFKIQYFY
jgi:hypothetical protein